MSTKGFADYTDTDNRDQGPRESVLTANFPHPYGMTTPLLGPDSFPMWFSPPYVFLFYVMAEIGGAFLLAFLTAGATWYYPGGFILNTLIRAAIIAGGYFILTLGWAKWTGATADVWMCWLVGFCEMFFSRKGGAMTPQGFLARFSVIGKMIIFPLCQFLGALMGVAAWSLIVDFAVITSDCGTGFAVSCAIRPVAFAISDKSASWTIFFGYLLVYGGQMLAWVFYGKKISLWVALLTKNFARGEVERLSQLDEEHAHELGVQGLSMEEKGESSHKAMAHLKVGHHHYVPWEINDEWGDVAKIVAGTVFVAHLLLSLFVGSNFNFWFWFVTSIYTKDYSQANLHVWPGLAAGLVLFVLVLIHFLLSSGTASYTSNALRNRSYKTL